MTPQTILNNARPDTLNVWPIPQSTNAPAYPVESWNTPYSGARQAMPDFADDAQMRHAYMVSCLEQDIAWQVRINRERRDLSQRVLAEKIGTKQSAIARAEDPAYGKLSLATLSKIAEAFECALMLRFVGYDRFFSEVSDTSEDALYVKPFQEIGK